MNLTTFFLFLLNLTLFSCSGKISKRNPEGVVMVRYRFYYPQDLSRIDTNFSSDFKILYKGTYVVEEIKQLNFHEDTAGVKTRWFSILGYIFIDFSTDFYYCYKNFSDTSKIIKKNVLDSIDRDLGWNFLKPKNVLFTGNPEELNDTVINNIIYKRVFFNRSVGKSEMKTIGYFQYNAPSKIFTFDSPYAEKLGCPMVKVYDYPINKNESSSFAEFDFTSNKLTLEEQRVFDSWINNARTFGKVEGKNK